MFQKSHNSSGKRQGEEKVLISCHLSAIYEMWKSRRSFVSRLPIESSKFKPTPPHVLLPNFQLRAESNLPSVICWYHKTLKSILICSEKNLLNSNPAHHTSCFLISTSGAARLPLALSNHFEMCNLRWKLFSRTWLSNLFQEMVI